MHNINRLEKKITMRIKLHRPTLIYNNSYIKNKHENELVKYTQFKEAIIII